MNYKSLKSVFVVSAIIITFFPACNKQKEEKQEVILPQQILSDSFKDITGYVVDYLKNGNDEFLIVDTIKIDNSIDIINPVKDSTKLKINKDTEIAFQTFSFDSTGNFNFNEKLDYERFINLLSSKDFVRFRNIPFKFVIKNGITISIKEIYIP